MNSRYTSVAILFAVLWLKANSQTIPSSPEHVTETWNLHFQLTTVTQSHGSFPAPYSGANSLSPNNETKTSLTATMFAGIRLFEGVEAFCNPELVAGEGLSHTLGIAGFPNGEIFRVGDPGVKFSISRIFVRTTIGLGGGTVQSESDANQLAGSQDATRLWITLGKFSVVDYFDDNKYSHDARMQFLNWSLMDNGAWDYPADTRGYTWGVAMEYINPQWTLRGYCVAVPAEANGMRMDPYIARANAEALEFEYRHSLLGRPGSIRFSGYVNNANMGVYEQALAAGGGTPDITTTRHYGTTKYGLCVGLDQEIAENLGLFMRSGWNDGKTETWAFTEIDRTLSLGTLLKGGMWGRAGDAFGIATVLNGISEDHKAYLAAGGNGFIIGDGKLSYAPEFITEAFYQVSAWDLLFLTVDYQFVSNPGYNKDRGPVSVFSARIHIEH